MTREEFEQYAIENDLVVWSKEASEKAIKALEQESCKDCGDLIYRCPWCSCRMESEEEE